MSLLYLVSLLVKQHPGTCELAVPGLHNEAFSLLLQLLPLELDDDTEQLVLQALSATQELCQSGGYTYSSTYSPYK